MPAPRITMRKIRDVLRLRLSVGLSIREIKASTKLSVGGIQKLLAKAKALGLTWPLPDDLRSGVSKACRQQWLACALGHNACLQE